MSQTTSNAANYSFAISFLHLLTGVFIAAKLFHVVTWSWWFVLLPLWGPPALFTVLLFFVVLTAGLIAVVSHFSN
jgi:hypothetical protein